MRYSALRDKMAVAVFTSSERDYRITSGHGVSPIILSLLDRIGRSTDPFLPRGFNGFIGVGPWPGESNCLLAFRVFNIGMYQNRPNTIAVVGVAAPLRSARDWDLSQLLAALPPPQIDRDYALPATLDVPGGAGGAEYVRLAVWDEEHGDCPPPRFVTFSEDHGICDAVQRITIPRGTSTAGRRWRRRCLLVVLLAALIGSSLALLWPWGPRTIPPPPVRVTFDKQRLQKILFDSGVPGMDSPAAGAEALAGITMETASVLRKRMDKLRSGLDLYRSHAPPSGFFEQQAICRAHLEIWIVPPSFQTSPFDHPESAPNQDVVDQAISVHRQYQTCFSLLEDVCKADLENQGRYGNLLDRLRKALAAD